jgi:hypothetical protein
MWIAFSPARAIPRRSQRTASDQENAKALLKVIEKLDELIAVQREAAGKPVEVKLPANVQPKAGAAAGLNDP